MSGTALSVTAASSGNGLSKAIPGFDMAIEEKTTGPCVICGHYDTTHVFTKQGFELVRCRSCDLVFVPKQPEINEINNIYSFASGYHIEYVSEGSTLKAETARARRHLGYLRRHKTAGRLLDIGCSAGFFLKEARAAGWEVCGVELSEDTAAIARRRFGLDVRTGVLTDDLFALGSFDAVTLWDVVEHLKDPISVLVTARRLLRRDGILLVETPNIDGLFPRLSYKVAALLDYWPHPEPPGHLFQFSKKTIGRLLDSAGLRVVEIGDGHIPLSYSFGSPASLVRSPKRLAYALAFAPFAMIGPMLGQGDSLVAAATKG
jgi:SAM-dependent methyltransferase